MKKVRIKWRYASSLIMSVVALKTSGDALILYCNDKTFWFRFKPVNSSHWFVFFTSLPAALIGLGCAIHLMLSLSLWWSSMKISIIILILILSFILILLSTMSFIVYDRRQECPAWAKMNHCKKSNWIWMVNNCPWSCNVPGKSLYAWSTNKP